MQSHDAVIEWSARGTSEATSRTDAVRLHDAEPMEFILSSNWVLKTEGVKDFYEVLYRRDENLEITYDHTLHVFRVKCLSHKEVGVVSLVKDTLDQLVQKETEKGLVGSHLIMPICSQRYLTKPQEASSKIISLEDWRKNESRLGQEFKVPDKYLFPRDVAACNIRDTWDISETWFKAGITTNRMLPESARSQLQRLTGTVLVTSSNGRTVYVGASGIEKAIEVKRKLHTLAQFLSLTPRDMKQVVKIFLYSEGDRSVMGEYRYVADGNGKLLRNYILDRFDWPHPEERYPTVFQKGVLVRLNPDNEPWEEAQSLSDTVLPIVKEGNTREEFGAFKLSNWRYPTKGADSSSSLLISDASTAQSGQSRTAYQPVLRPEIENWVSNLPALNNNRPGISSQKDTTVVSQAPKKATEHPTSSKILLAGNSTSAAAREQSQSNEPDPFALLWRRYRPLPVVQTSKSEETQSCELNPQTLPSTETREPQLAQNNERASRSLRITMNQKAGSRTVRNVFPEFDPDMMMSINKSLADLMAPLRMWSGVVDLRIDLGRFYFLNVKKSHIQEPGDDDDEKYYKLERIRTELNKRHTSNEKLHFTRVLTKSGADANYIAHMSDKDGNPMWKRPAHERSSTYEFICRSKTLEGAELNFVVGIDATKFYNRVKQFKPDQNCFMVHCTKRVWDFRLVLSISQNLDDTCVRFAKELTSSLRVTPKNDGIPELEVSYDKNYDVEVLAVRTRNTACCNSEVSIKNTHRNQGSSHADVQRLYISEVWEMGLLSKGELEQRIQLKFARYKNNERSGMPLLWYEAILKSDTFSTAFEQNGKLELGNEVRWTPEELLKSGAVEELIRKAANVVKNMDGVGFWSDNLQTELQRRIVPAVKPAKGQYTAKFW
ncbi:hypothetical protein E0Z10_g1109 [Xylaria hypoxylon]|uniref:DUF7905 domain-containing protein n=1 Tax=Xylaria hypoxylon TaxID=37992 RepID=A0A4Z0ZFQ1_9PEZI|nr:hypothetical protein E0Z10_g1109 [Xylaria hypoxylon]